MQTPIYLWNNSALCENEWFNPTALIPERSVDTFICRNKRSRSPDRGKKGFESLRAPKHQRGGVLEKNSPCRDDSLAAKPEGIRVDPRCIEPSVLKWSAAVQIGHPNSRFVLPETGSDRSSPRFRPGCCIFSQNLSPCPTFWCNLTRPLHQKQLQQP